MLRARVITALILVSAFGFALFGFPALGWMLLMSLVAGLAGWEWGGLAGYSMAGRVGYGALTSMLCMGISMLPAGRSEVLMGMYVLAVAFWLLAVPFMLYRKPQPGKAFPLVGWLVLLPAFSAAIQLRAVSPWLLLGLMAAVWVADIAAYFTGRAFGRRKLAPGISPGKSWEGVWGAVAGVLVFAIAILMVRGAANVPGSVLLWVPLVLLYTAVSIEGDLFESLLKRQAGIKDSSQLLPGHGGILDRVDSLTSTLPLAGLLYSLWST